MDLKKPDYLQLLLNRIMSEHLNITIDDFTRLGINIQTCRVLISLHHHKHLRSGILAYLIGLEPTATSHVLRSMSEQGLIHRERSSEDSRAVEIRLTAEGRELAQRCHKAALRQEKILTAGLNNEEIDFLRKIIWRIEFNIRGHQARAVEEQG
jgi:DNA-binding MarR family transcriptional regulator